MNKIRNWAISIGVILLSAMTTLASEMYPLIKTEVTSDSLVQIQSTQKYAEFNLGSKKANIQGVQHTLQEAPVVIEGQVYVPLRFVAEQILQSTLKVDAQTKDLVIEGNDKRIVLNIAQSKATIDGTEVPFNKAVRTSNKCTMIALKFISKPYLIEMWAENNSKTIILSVDSQSNLLNKMPVAAFKFNQEVYSEGQPIILLDASYDDDGGVKQRIWRINDSTSYKTTMQIEALLEKARPGSYSIALRVKDTRGALSDWCIQTTTVIPNETPVITAMTAAKENYAQGEPIELTYQYENEKWEGLKEQKWTYRHESESEKIAIQGKPSVIYTEGKYIVTLTITDDFGKISSTKETILTISDKVVEKELNYKFKHIKPGELIHNFGKVNYLDYSDVSTLTKTQSDATLVMSDSPENVSQKGILYRDYVTGEGRLLIHHINGFTEWENRADPKRLVIVAQNTSNKPIHLTIRNKTIKGPAQDILFIGQQLLVDYFKSTAYQTYTLKPNQKIYLYDSRSKSWPAETVISGKLDFSVDGQMLLSVAAIGKKTSIDSINGLNKPARDVHPRGTFSTTDYYYTIDIDKEKPTKMLLCKEEDEWLMGCDALTGDLVRNKGNYGVTYHITVTAKEDTGVIINPRGGVFKGAVQWGDREVYEIPTLGVLTSKERPVTLGIIKAGETVTINYILANGSAAPVLLGFIPESQWLK